MSAEHDFMRKMGRFPDVINPSQRLTALEWLCSGCESMLIFPVPVTASSAAPCRVCGGVCFEKVR